MERRLLLAVLLALTSASSVFDGQKKDAGTCSGTKKTCGDAVPSKAASKKANKAPLDVSVMWKKPEPPTKGHYYDEEKYDGRVAQAVLKKLEEKKYRVLEEKCSQLTGVCYEVVDRVWRNPEGFEQNKWEMIRQIQLKGQVDYHFGRSLLIKPTVLNWKTYDTKKWVINKYAVLDKEIQSLIGGITGSKAIPRNETDANGKEYQILLVGLGAPIIPNFMEQYHWMDMIVVEKDPIWNYFAGKWFNMRKHPNLRVLHADPISFMAFIVAQRHEIDAVIINTCKDYVDPRPCPADVYLERGTIEVIKNVVREHTGMAGVNARSMEGKHPIEVANAYQDSFPMCFDYPADHKQLTFERYKAAICFNREHPPFWHQSEKQYSTDSFHEFFFYI